MKIFKIYIDTSVIGGCFDKEFELYSNLLIKEIMAGKKIGIISELTKRELSNAPDLINSYFNSIQSIFKEVKINDDVEFLADTYIKEKVLNSKFINDCLHIALATFHNIDLLVSWNFKHIVNYEKIIKFNSVNLKYGYRTLQIYSPMEVINQNDKE